MNRLPLFILTLLALTACTSAAQTPTENRAGTLRQRLIEGDTTAVFVVAHRGDWRYAPENSLAAIEHSIKAGVDIVEVDLQLTRDSVLILLHDATLNRTTTGKGRVDEWTLDSIRTLHLRNGCGIATRELVPTLEEALLAIKDRVLLNLDKADRYFDLVYPLLEKTGTEHQIIMKGQRPAAEVQSLYGVYLEQIIYMPIVWLDKPAADTLMRGFDRDLKPAAYEFVYNDDANPRPRAYKQALRGKALLWYNTLESKLCAGHDDDLSLDNPDAAFGYLIDTLGARIIQTDRAEHLLQYLRSRGLHD